MHHISIRDRAGTALVCAIGVALLTTACADDTTAPGRSRSAASAHHAVDGGDSTPLPLGEPTSVTYKRGSDHLRGALQVTAVSVRKGARADLRGVARQAETRTAQPYYVTMRFKNVGDHSLHYPFLNAPTGLEDTSGVDDQPLVTADDQVKACPGKDPDDLAAGAEATLCKVFLVPNGAKPSVVTYGTGDDANRPVRWKVTKATG